MATADRHFTLKLSLKMRVEIVLFVVMLAEIGCEVSILIDDSTVDMDRDRPAVMNSYIRIKRGLVKESGELLVKVGKYGARFWRDYRAKQILLKDAKRFKNQIYIKEGGKRRAEVDYTLTLPDEQGTIGNQNIMLDCGKGIATLNNYNWNGPPPVPKCAVYMGKYREDRTLAAVPLTVYYI